MSRSSCSASMCPKNIYTKKDFRKWALRNHPDKGGDTSVFQSVSSCVSSELYCQRVEAEAEAAQEYADVKKEKAKAVRKGCKVPPPCPRDYVYRLNKKTGKACCAKRPAKKGLYHKRACAVPPPCPPGYYSAYNKKGKTACCSKKPTSKKPKSQKMKVAGKTRTVYTGARGGRYYMSGGKKHYVK